jgi:hypothetical protein
MLPSRRLEIRGQIEPLIFYAVNYILFSKFTKITFKKIEVVF